MSENESPQSGQQSFLDEMAEYKRSLQAAEQVMQSEYDKGLMTLSGGALGISLAFVKEVIGKKTIHDGGWFVGAWVLWGLSLTFVLASYFTSTKSLRNAADSVGNQTIYLDLAKCRWRRATICLNLASGLAFIAGVACIVLFIFLNMPNK